MKYFPLICALEFFILFISEVDLNLITGNSFMRNEELLESAFNESEENGFSQTIKEVRRSVVTANRSNIWDQGIVPYEIDNVYTGLQRKVITQAMQHWEQLTCIKFVKRIKELHNDYIFITKTNCKCCSPVGKQGNGKQIIGLQDRCVYIDIIVHELGHAIGFYHEHRRPDRDDYVEILFDNISKGYEFNFEKLLNNESTILGQTYDFDSIMHYGHKTFAKNNSVSTIKTKPQIDGYQPKLSQKYALSQGDIAGANRLYNCRKCGETFMMPKGTIRLPAYSNNQELRDEPCEWTVKVAEGQRIKLSIKFFGITNNTDCLSNSLEIRTSYWRNTDIIAQYCANVDTTVIANSNIVVILLKLMHYEKNYLDFVIEYEAICGKNIFMKGNETIYLESPNYPGPYRPNEVCSWNIDVPLYHFILIEFYYFDLEESPNCENDVLEVQESDDSFGSYKRSYCGKYDDLKIASVRNQMLVGFFTDNLKNGNGFSAAITARSIDD